MTWPVPTQYPITTKFGKRGRHWRCLPDGAGLGSHTGADFDCPVGTPVYATIKGQVRHRNYGSAFGGHQFAISPDPGQPFGDGEVFYAHTRTRLADGTWVEPGDKVAEVGMEGNTTGPHLHYEFHPTAKNKWDCSLCRDPAPTLTSGTGALVTPNIYSNKLGYGEPSNGDSSSDTVKELQSVLNTMSLPAPGNVALRVDGTYGDATDLVVRTWQKSIGNTPDAPKQSYLGPAQRVRVFGDPPYTIHDTGLPAVAVPSVPAGPGTTLGRYLKAQGFTVHDEDVPLGRESEWQSVQFLMVHHTGSSDSHTPAADAAYVRTGTQDAPLAQLMLDRNAEVWTCCQQRDRQAEPGRASHAGLGHGFDVPDNQMNEVSLGIEVQNDGTKPLSSNPKQYDTLIRLLAALATRYGVPTGDVIGHKEWSSTGKPDPLDNMDALRADVDVELGGSPPTLPPTSGSGRLWMEYSGKPAAAQVLAADAKWHLVEGIPLPAPPIAGSEHHMLYARLNFTWKPGTTGHAKVECRYTRDGGDDTAFDERHYEYGTKSVPFQQLHFEEGEVGRGGKWYLKVHGALTRVEVTTRYAKVHVIGAK